MAHMIRRHWSTGDLTGLPRKDRAGCDYDAYLPDDLVGRRFMLDGETAADVSDAEANVARLNASAVTLADTEALARLLLRAEAVGSSHIEGLVVGGRRLLRFEVASELGSDEARDVTADEVLSNIRAMDYAVHTLANEQVTVDGILEMHRLLLEDTDRAQFAGRLREEQNWIGGSSYNPCSAAFIPPPEDDVPRLLADLCTFANGDSLPPIAQAAVAHAQFETIHPFVDGNGRAGRALIHVILRRRGLCPKVVPPISLILATRSSNYIAGLTAFRHVGPADSAAAREGLNHWVATFAAATSAAAHQALAFEDRIEEIKRDWQVRLGRLRRNSAAERLVDLLPGTPIVTSTSAAALLDRSFNAANDAIERFVDAGILTKMTVGRRNRAWEAREILDAFTDLERGLASPTGDTRAAEPVRRVPARPPS